MQPVEITTALIELQEAQDEETNKSIVAVFSIAMYAFVCGVAVGIAGAVIALA